MKEYVLKTNRSKAYFIFYTFIRFNLFVILKIIFRMKVYGRENIPASGRLIICSNHLSYIDPGIHRFLHTKTNMLYGQGPAFYQ